MFTYWPSMPTQFKYFAMMVCVVAVGVVVLWIANLLKLRKSGINPLTAEADIINKALASQAMAPSTSIEDRLAELDRLKAEGKISDEEHSAARAAVLSGK
jgi:competence protein ComGC